MNKLRLLLIFFLIAVAGCNQMPEDVYKVVKIKDGDTIELLSSDFKNITIRLAEIDCPEKAQAYGQAARQFTAQLCFGKEVRIQGGTQDRYGRTVATVLLTDGTNINNELVKNGYAWQYKAYSKNNPELAALEQQAREAHLGLWQDANPTEPWNFRRHKTAGSTTQKAEKKPTKKPRKKRRKKKEVEEELETTMIFPWEGFWLRAC
ncbi:thermonuclease family protein [Mucilaginibacter gynuensis]